MLSDEVIGPSLGLILWTVALITLVILVVIAAYRWAQLGLGEALSPILRGSLFVCVVTIVWVFPGVAAAGALTLAVVTRRLLAPRRYLPSGEPR